MKVKLSALNLIVEGRPRQVLWEVVDWEIEEAWKLPTSDTLLVFPRTGVHGSIPGEGFTSNASIATGRLNGWDPPCGTIRVETPDIKSFRVGMREYLVPEHFTEERGALVQTEQGLWVTRAIYCCEKLVYAPV